jgi:hypothetical protein
MLLNVALRANEEVLRRHCALCHFSLAITMVASRATSAGAVSEGLTATQRLAPKIACSRFRPSGESA